MQVDDKLPNVLNGFSPVNIAMLPDIDLLLAHLTGTKLITNTWYPMHKCIAIHFLPVYNSVNIGNN